MARVGGSRSTWLVSGLVLAALLRSIGCGDGGGGPQANANVQAVLADLGPEVVVPALLGASTAADALAARCAEWSAAVTTDGDAETARAAAQDAWREAMAAWQAVELLQIGPAASSLTAVAGEDRRDGIYSWPSVNACRVDQVTVTGGWDSDTFYDENLVNVYGLAALETLLFSGATNACPPQVDINAEGLWDALGTDALDAARASYAAAVAGRVAQDVTALLAAWDPAQGDFSGQIASAGADGSPYASDVEGLNAVLDALFYFETTVKERKLGRPLGLETCTSCAGEVESPLAGDSHVWLQVNVAAGRALFEGGAGYGLDDLLRDEGNGDLTDRVLAAFDAADAAAAALTVPVDEAAAGDPTPAVAVYDAVDGIVDLLEAEVAAVLVLQIPSEAAGDND